jgi:hypothetical protein
MMTEDLRQRIDAIPGDEGWIKGSKKAMAIAEEMLTIGASDDQVEKWISAVYWAAATEYGG